MDKALAQAQRSSASGAPTLTLRDLLQPQRAISEHSAAMLAKFTNGGVREGLVRVVRAASAKSYVPLVPLYAGIAGWRKHLSAFPALAALNAELKDVRLTPPAYDIVVQYHTRCSPWHSMRDMLSGRSNSVCLILP